MAISKEVCGFYPNWLSSTLYQSLNYESLTTIAWAFLGLNSDGSLVKSAYPPAGLISNAHSRETRVVVSVNPGYGSSIINSILANSSLQTTIINNLLYEVQSNGFDGVDIDFEGFPTTNPINGQSNRASFTNFMIQLSNSFKSVNPNYRISINLPPMDWEGVFDTATLSPYVTYMMIMGYDYHWANGPTAGAVAPLTSPNNQSVTNSVNNYLQTIPKSKLLLGVPYYGYEWQTQNQQPDSPTIGMGASITYVDALNKVATYGRQWSSTWSSPFYLTGSGQGWYDDTESLGLKYELVNTTGIAGIGIWALGYDGSRPELPNLILSKFGGGCPNSNQINILGICMDSKQLLIAGAVFAGFLILEM